MSSKRLLITGAGGRIASAYRKHLVEQNTQYEVRCADIQEPKDQNLITDWHTGNLGDFDFVRQIVTNCDYIVHLGADADPEADFYGSLLENNIKATYNLFQAAAENKVSRVVYASSSSVVFGYQQTELGIQVHSQMPVRPITMYSATKCFGEAVGSVFAHNFPLSVICVRIGFYMPREELINQTNPNINILSRIITDRDICHLFDCCLDVSNVSFATVAGISNNRYPFLDLTDTKKLLGYAPQDDAFALTGIIK